MYTYVGQNLDCKEYFFINHFLPPSPLSSPCFHFVGVEASEISWLFLSDMYQLRRRQRLTGGKQLKSKALTWLGPPFPERPLSPFPAICFRARSVVSLQVQRWSCQEEQSPHLPCLLIKVLVLHQHPYHVAPRHQVHSGPLEMARESPYHLIFILSFKLESHKVTVKSLKTSTSNCPCVCVSGWSVF